MKKSRVKEAQDRFDELMYKPTEDLTDDEVELMLDYAHYAITQVRRERILHTAGEFLKIAAIAAISILLIRFVLSFNLP